MNTILALASPYFASSSAPQLPSSLASVAEAISPHELPFR